MKNKVFCGFSANPEFYREFITRENNKNEITKHQLLLSGSSVNIAKCLQNMNQSPHTLIFTGQKNGIENSLYYEALKSLLYEENIPYTHFEVLKETNFAEIFVDKQGQNHLFSNKGVIVQELLKNAYELIQSGLDEEIEWLALSGVRLEEYEIAKLVLKKAKVGKRLLIPKPELIASPRFNELIQDVDLLIMNKAEFAVYGNTDIESFHNYGPKFVIITDSSKGGLFSVGHGVAQYEPYPILASSNFSEVGCGDWFSASILAYVLENGIPNLELSQNQAVQATNFAAQVSAKKLAYPGGSNGPMRNDITSE